MRPKRFRLYMFAFVVAFAMGSCSPPAADSENGTAVPTPTSPMDVELATATPPGEPDPTATAPPEQGLSPEPGGDPAQEPDPTGEPMIGSEGQPLDTCLVGTWTMDNDSLAQYLENGLNQGRQVDNFSVTEITGNMQLTFSDDGIMSLTSDVMELTIFGQLSEQLTTEITMLLVAEGEATYQADGNILSSMDQVFYAAGAPLDGLLTNFSQGSTVGEIYIAPDFFFDRGPVDGSAPSTGIYSCSEDQLTLATNAYGAVSFARASMDQKNIVFD